MEVHEVIFKALQLEELSREREMAEEQVAAAAEEEPPEDEEGSKSPELKRQNSRSSLDKIRTQMNMSKWRAVARAGPKLLAAASGLQGYSSSDDDESHDDDEHWMFTKLRKIPLLRRLDDEILHTLSHSFHKMTYPTGSYVTKHRESKSLTARCSTS
jgi:hypothetical protein